MLFIFKEAMIKYDRRILNLLLIRWCGIICEAGPEIRMDWSMLWVFLEIVPQTAWMHAMEGKASLFAIFAYLSLNEYGSLISFNLYL